MSDTKHTKGELKQVGARYLWITGEHGAAIALIAEPECNNSGDIHPVSIDSERWDEAMANADELVRRWNTHPALLEALDNMIKWAHRSIELEVSGSMKLAAEMQVKAACETLAAARA